MTTTLGRRLVKLETAACEDQLERFRAAVRALRDSLAPDQAHALRDWILGHDIKAVTCPSFHPDNRFCLGCVEEYDPPALVRALWLLLAHHAHDGTPVSLAPSVAEVYLNDPHAYPSNPCEGCGYLLPAHSTIRPDGSYRHLAWYLGECPVCGLDNHPEEGETPTRRFSRSASACDAAPRGTRSPASPTAYRSAAGVKENDHDEPERSRHPPGGEHVSGSRVGDLSKLRPASRLGSGDAAPATRHPAGRRWQRYRAAAAYTALPVRPVLRRSEAPLGSPAQPRVAG